VIRQVGLVKTTRHCVVFARVVDDSVRDIVAVASSALDGERWSEAVALITLDQACKQIRRMLSVLGMKQRTRSPDTFF
jgi:hypothetical protein